MSEETTILYTLAPGAKPPSYAHEGDAGADIFCLGYFTISPGNLAIVSTGLTVEIPKGFEIQIRSKSGLASGGVQVFNSPGTIDQGYRGEIKVILYSVSDEEISFQPGSKIAQMVLSPVYRAKYTAGNYLAWEETSRGVGGFGSTGN